MFHPNFYPKQKIDPKDTEISQETRQKLLVFQQGYDDIVSKHSGDIGLTNLEEMKIDTDQNLPPVASKPYPWNINKIVSEEIENLLEAGLIQRSMSPFAALIIVVHRKSKPGAPLTETKRLVINYCELNKQIPKVQTPLRKTKCNQALMETAR